MAHRFFEDKLQAWLYAQHRPKPPPAIVERVMSFLREKYTGDLSLAVDAGCGSGQAALRFVPFFHRVLALDVSPEQIKLARDTSKCEGVSNVEFWVSEAETMDGVHDGAAQLVVACASIHWFDLPKFYAEVERVLCLEGVLAVIGYGYWKLHWKQNPGKDKKINRLMNHLLYDDWKQYWPPANSLALDDYVDLKLPMRDAMRCVPDFEFVREMRLMDYPKFFQTMSPYRNAVRLGQGDKVKAQIDKWLEDVLQVLDGDVAPGTNLAEIRFTEINNGYLLMARK